RTGMVRKWSRILALNAMHSAWLPTPGTHEKSGRRFSARWWICPKDQSALVAEYLGKNFPEKPKPPAVVIPGSVTVSIKEWVVPSLGSRPHDPLATADGNIWWTGQWASVLGRLNPRTGEMKEVPL